VLVFFSSQLKAVLIPVGAPVESGSVPVATLAGVAWSVTARLHNIDFTRCGPRSKLVSLGKHPNGGPKPVALGELGIDLNTAILGIERVY
jgi:hypothetical protein